MRDAARSTLRSEDFDHPTFADRRRQVDQAIIGRRATLERSLRLAGHRGDSRGEMDRVITVDPEHGRFEVSRPVVTDRDRAWVAVANVRPP